MKLPIIFLDLSYGYQIPIDKVDDVYNRLFTTINKELNIKDDDYYRLTVYPHHITNKTNVTESEHSYNCIVDTVRKITDIRDMKLKTIDNIGLVLMGKYSEYSFIRNILNSYSIRTACHFELIKSKAVYTYLDTGNNFRNIVKNECGKINQFLFDTLGGDWHKQIGR